MNLPNKLTLLRIILIPVFMIFAFPLPEFLQNLVSAIPYFDLISAIAAFVIFAAASFTDYLDGYIARKNNLVTDFGKFLDPIADKLLVVASLLALVAENKIYIWATMIILMREFIITGFRLIAAGKGVVIAAGKLGKLKTVTQMIAIVVLLFARVLRIGTVYSAMQIAGNVVMFISVILTIVSGVEYVYKNRALISTK